MIAIPAVDLREGACVQLVGGSYSDERVRLEDPPMIACRWTAFGFRRLHVVDLDAATGRGDNRAVVDRILSETKADIQVGGGIRTISQIDGLLAAGARFAVIGTRALESPEWLEEIASRYPGRIIVAADVRDRQVVTHGWNRELPTDIADLLTTVSSLALAAILVTAVHVEGKMSGPDVKLYEDLVGSTPHAIIASGGIGNMADLRALQEREVAGAVIGMALYTGALDPCAVAEEFAK